MNTVLISPEEFSLPFLSVEDSASCRVKVKYLLKYDKGDFIVSLHW